MGRSSMRSSKVQNPETETGPGVDATASSPLAKLHKNISKHFNEEELRTLCSDLDVDYDDLPALGKTNKARELVGFMMRTTRIAELVKECRRLRPKVDWQDILPSPSTGEAVAVISPPQSKAREPAKSLPFVPEMVHIPAGPFLMGSNPELDRDSLQDEMPQHILELPSYSLSKTPITNIQYSAFVQDTGYTSPIHWTSNEPPRGKEDHPVVNVSWYDAIAYCCWLSAKSGRAFRLPSEAEWEKGARGQKGIIYCWGNCWSEGRCNTKEAGKRQTTSVRAYRASSSPYGLLDMLGNVWEWTRSLWGEQEGEAEFRYEYDPADGREDEDAPPQVRRVVRGGSAFYPHRLARCAVRKGGDPSLGRAETGFRIVAAQ